MSFSPNVPSKMCIILFICMVIIEIQRTHFKSYCMVGGNGLSSNHGNTVWDFNICISRMIAIVMLKCAHCERK